MKEIKKLKSIIYQFLLLVFPAMGKQAVISGLFKEPMFLSLKGWNIYQSTNDLPYEIFKKCCVDKTFSLLGVAPKDILERAWLKIYSEYAQVSEDENIQGIIHQMAEVNYLDSRIFRVRHFCAQIKKNGTSEFLAGKLKELGYRFSFTEESYLSDIERVERKLNNLVVKRDAIIRNINEETKGEETVTYAAFDQKVSEIERVFKVPIFTKDLTTQMYAIKIRDLRNHYRNLQNNSADIDADQL